MTTTLNLDHLYRAQFGEDRILWQVFGHRPHGYYIEIGAYDGVTLSNTFFLEQMGWTGLLIEPIPALARHAAAQRPRSRVIQAAISRRNSQGSARFTVADNVPVLSFLSADEEHVARCIREGARLTQIDVPVTSLDELLRSERRNAPRDRSPWIPNRGWQIDLVSIDTEGSEMDVLDGFALERFRPRVLLIENDKPSGSAIEPHLRERGYRKFHRQKINDFYARTDTQPDELQLEGLIIPP